LGIGGNFTTIPGITTGSIALLWTPVPEPLHILLVAGVGAAAWAGSADAAWKRRINRG